MTLAFDHSPATGPVTRQPPAQRMPRDVYNYMCRRADLYKAGPRDRAAQLTLPTLLGLMDRYPAQPMLAIVAIDNLLDIPTTRPGDMMNHVRRYVTQMEVEGATAATLLWPPSKHDARRCNDVLMRLLDAQHLTTADRLLSIADPLFTGETAECLDRARTHLAAAKADQATGRPLGRQYRGRVDAPDDVWSGYEVERPHMETNSQWESWMNDA